MKINIPEFEKRVASRAIKKFEHPTEPSIVGWCYTDRCQYDKMWDEHTILARGIVTTRDGLVVSRPFPKFFNLGEVEAEPINWKEPVEVSEKIDGSLICVYTYDEKIFVNSKGSFTSEHAQFARKWIQENLPNWKPNDCYTYLFEAVFPSTNENEVKVINYGDRADLTLLAIINILTGDEYNYEEMKKFADHLKIPLIARYTSDVYATIDEAKSRASIQEGEGIVIHFLESNKRIKVKSDVYIRLHRLISHANKKTILEMIMKGDNIEEIYSPLPDEFYRDVKKWVEEFTLEHTRTMGFVNEHLPAVKVLPTRSAQAKYVYGTPELASIQGLMFMALDGRDISYPAWELIKKRLKEKKE
jgi:RNA ligase